MKSLPPFLIMAWDKTEQVFGLVSWREREQVILLFDAAGSPKILKLSLPKLDQKGWQYITNPFPDARPVSIEAVRLICPPCRGNAEEAAKLAAPPVNSGPQSASADHQGSEWEKAWVESGGEVLSPEPEDTAALRALKEELLARKHEEFEARKRQLATLTLSEFRYLQITKQVSGTCAFLSADSDTLRRFVREESFHLDFEINQPLSETTIGIANANRASSRLHIEQEYSDLACSYLRDKWLQQHGLNLAVMERDRRAVLDFLRKHASNVMESVPESFDPQALAGYRERQHDAARRPGLRLTPNEELVLCAQVRYVLTFSDESRVWLAAVKLRQPHADEEREIEACLGESQAAPLEDVIPKLVSERKKLEAVPVELAARTKDLAETLGKVAEVFADPLVAAAKDTSIKRGVPPEFAWWVFQERHFDKFPTVGGALKRCGLGPKLRKGGFAFSRPTVGRWLKIIHEELEQRKLTSKRSPRRRSVKARDFDVAQAKDTGLIPGDADEPPEAFVQWVEDQDAARTMPTEEDVLTYLSAHADRFGLTYYGEDKLTEIAKKWLKKAVEILDAVRTGPPNLDNDSDLRDDD